MLRLLIRTGKITGVLLLLNLWFSAFAASPANDEVKASATDKGKSVSNDYISRNILPTSSGFNYFDACSYYGALRYGEAVNDSSFFKTIYNRYKSNKPGSIATGDVDKNSNGLLPLYLFVLSGDSSLLKLGKAAADASLQAKGYPRYAIDDTYMTGSLMVQAYRATKDMKYLDFFAGYMIDYTNKLQQSSGLYWHKTDSKNFWGRGNGWGAAGATELLLELPTTHARYDSVLTGYKNHMKGLLDNQKSSGMWMQLIGSTDGRNWEETSGTAMFLFAIFTGIEKGWLERDTYLEPAKKGWMALTGYLQGSKLRNVAAGFWPSTGTANDYLNAAKGSPGDPHGTAAFIWAATAAIKCLTPTAAIPSVRQRIPAAFTVTGTDRPLLVDLTGRTVTTDITATPPAGLAVPGVYLSRTRSAAFNHIIIR